jgi:hypothetical protein
MEMIAMLLRVGADDYDGPAHEKDLSSANIFIPDCRLTLKGGIGSRHVRFSFKTNASGWFEPLA